MHRMSGMNGRWASRPAWLVVGVAIGLAGAGLLRVWPAAAQPQVLPNAADQRNAMVLELRAANARLESIRALLASGEVTVKVEEAPNQSPPGGGAGGMDR